MTMLVEDHCRDEIEAVSSMAREAVSSMAREAGVPMEWDSRHGVPHEVIAEYADAVDADCVVVGHHGQPAEHCGGVRRRLLERLNREVVVAPPEA
jgi:nucleotide-binding universal stress UspA family protein